MIDNNAKIEINLLHPELFPEEPLITLNRVAFIWFIILASMLGWSQYNDFQLNKLQSTAKVLSAEHNNKQLVIADYQQQIQAQKTDTGLEAKLSTLKMVMRNKQALHARLTDPEQTYVAGFAASMTELSKYHHQDISLQKVIIAQNEMLFSGLAKNPDSVPQWLSGFEQSALLSGKNFKNFQLYENEHQQTVFNIGSTFAELSKRGAK
ncbi:MAG: hypothetical protein ACSHW0_01300 [Thalassotalea sp.]